MSASSQQKSSSLKDAIWALLPGSISPQTELLTNANHGSSTGKQQQKSGNQCVPYGSLESSCNADTSSSDSSSNSSSASSPSSSPLPTRSGFLPTTPTTNGFNQKKKGSLSILQLATIIFYSVSGGPFGIEEAVRSAGPFYTLIGFLVGPLIFSIPECLMTVELSSGGFQSSAAGCAWVEEAFGTTTGFMAGLLSWVSGATDNAIYPALFLSYAMQLFPVPELMDDTSIWRFTMLTSISVGLAYMNWMGLELVGNMSIGVCIVTMSPFVVFVIFGASQVDPHRWFLVPSDFDSFERGSMGMENATLLGSLTGDYDDDDDAIDMERGFIPNVVLGGVILRPLLNNLFWQYNSFDNAGSFAEDIRDPAHVLPRAMSVGFLMVVLGYIIPLLVALGVTDAAPEEWVDGYMATVVTDTIGSWMGKWLVFAAALSNLGQFQAELSADAYMLMGMAERGHLPKILSTRSANGTPTNALLLGTLVIVISGVSNLDGLIEMLNFNYALALLLEYAAFIKLRISKPDAERPCRVPLSTTACAIALTPTITILILVIALASYTTIFVNLGIIATGTSIYALVQMKNNFESSKTGYDSLLVERNREYTSLL